MAILIGFLLAWVTVARAQLNLPPIRNEITPANMPQIVQLDVDCAKTGMTVNIQFSAPFNGVIFSKGHFANPACRFVSTDSPRQTDYGFQIPLSECGTTVFQSQANNDRGYEAKGPTIYQNTIVIQNDNIVQEFWDTARTIYCEWFDNVVRTVASEPLSVKMLDTVELRFSGDNMVDIWMDLQVGKWPGSKDVSSVVRIGEDISVLIFAQDQMQRFDMQVRDCYASSSTNFDDQETISIQLTDVNGCVIKEKLIGPFVSTRIGPEAGTGHGLVSVAYLQAFKFPDKMEVYLTCNVEICKTQCEKPCQIFYENSIESNDVPQPVPVSQPHPTTYNNNNNFQVTTAAITAASPLPLFPDKINGLDGSNAFNPTDNMIFGGGIFNNELPPDQQPSLEPLFPPPNSSPQPVFDPTQGFNNHQPPAPVRGSLHRPEFQQSGPQFQNEPPQQQFQHHPQQFQQPQHQQFQQPQENHFQQQNFNHPRQQNLHQSAEQEPQFQHQQFQEPPPTDAPFRFTSFEPPRIQIQNNEVELGKTVSIQGEPPLPNQRETYFNPNDQLLVDHAETGPHLPPQKHMIFPRHPQHVPSGLPKPHPTKNHRQQFLYPPHDPKGSTQYIGETPPPVEGNGHPPSRNRGHPRHHHRQRLGRKTGEFDSQGRSLDEREDISDDYFDEGEKPEPEVSSVNGFVPINPTHSAEIQGHEMNPHQRQKLAVFLQTGRDTIPVARKDIEREFRRSLDKAQKHRRKRSITLEDESTVPRERGQVKVTRAIHVIAPEDVSIFNDTSLSILGYPSASEIRIEAGKICISFPVFSMTLSILMVAFLSSFFCAIWLCKKVRHQKFFLEVETMATSSKT